jgi:hypothetical protein
VALWRLAVFKLPPSTTTNTNKIAASPINQEPSEMQINFITFSKISLCAPSANGAKCNSPGATPSVRQFNQTKR